MAGLHSILRRVRYSQSLRAGTRGTAQQACRFALTQRQALPIGKG